MKKTNILLKITKVLCVLLLSTFTLAACSQPTSTPSDSNSNSTSDNSNNSDSSNDTDNSDSSNNPGDSDNPENPVTPPPTPTQQQILLIFPQTSVSTYTPNTWVDINFISGNDLNTWQNNFTSSSSCEIEIMENGNESNISLEAVIHSSKVSVKANKEGTIYFRVKNNNANIVSNYTMVSFANTSTNTNNPARFYGTWVTTDTYLINTITFNQNGSGEQYNSNYSSSRTNITWSVTNTNTIHISSSGSSCNATYSFSEDLQTLSLTNFWDYNQTLTFTKQ